MNFQRFLAVLFWRRRLALGVLACTVMTTLIASLVMPKTYKATTTLVIDYRGTDPISGTTMPGQLMPSYLATQVEIIGSRNVALKVVDKLDLARNPPLIEAFNRDTGGEGSIREWLANALLKKLDVKPSRESSAIDVSFENQSSQFAAAVANAFGDAYIQTNRQLNIEPARRTAEWFGDQIKNLRDNLLTAQQNLADFQHKTGVVSLDERLDVESAKLAQLANQLVLAQAQTIESRSRQNQVYSGRRLDQLNTDISSSREREASIRAALERQKVRVMEMNQQRDKLGILQGDVATAQKVLDAAMQRFSQTRMEGQAEGSEVAVLDQATPPMKPSRPKILLNLLVSVFLGSMLAASVTLLAEMRDRRVHDQEDLSHELNLPVLGVVSLAERPSHNS